MLYRQQLDFLSTQSQARDTGFDSIESFVRSDRTLVSWLYAGASTLLLWDYGVSEGCYLLMEAH